MKGMAKEEHGAALLTILLFVAIMAILVVTMLSTVSHEVAISGLHRDSVRAFELAQAGLSEGVLRVQAGHAYAQPFFGSLDPQNRIRVEVVNRVLGQSGGYLEVQSEATIGPARRKLSTFVLASARSVIPKTVFGYSFASNGSATVTGGDVYSRTYVNYKTLPTSASTITYAGWGIGKRAPSPIPYCYQPPCAGQANWYPGTRRANVRDEQFRPVGIPVYNPVADTRSGATVLNFTCPGGPPAPYASQTVQADGPGFVPGVDKRADRNLVIPAGPPLLLYGCEADGFPYTWVREAVDSDDPDSTPDQFMWFKTIVFEDWFAKYWCFNPDPNVLTYEKCGGLQSNGALGAVPPFPDFETLAANYDQYQTGGGVINASSTLDFGCKDPEMSCPGGQSRPTIVLLDNGNYTINSNLQGYGVLLVDGDLTVNGTLEYWGTLIANGTLTLGSGTVIIHGGLIAKDTAEISGNITVDAGVALANVILGPADVTTTAWWER